MVTNHALVKRRIFEKIAQLLIIYIYIYISNVFSKAIDIVRYRRRARSMMILFVQDDHTIVVRRDI